MDKINQIIYQHHLYVNTNGEDGAKADFKNCNLRGTIFIGLNISKISFRGADLRGASFIHCTMEQNDFTNAKLSGAMFHGGKIYNTKFDYAIMQGVKIDTMTIENSSFMDVNLAGSTLYKLIFQHNTIRNSNFSGVIIDNTNLDNQSFINTDLKGAKILFSKSIDDDCIYLPIACPEVGEFIGWKKTANDTITRLLIPDTAKRISGASAECRANEVIVVSISDIYTGKKYSSTTSIYDNSFKYTVGETIFVENFNDNRWDEENGNGIHFFLSRKDALNS